MAKPDKTILAYRCDKFLITATQTAGDRYVLQWVWFDERKQKRLTYRSEKDVRVVYEDFLVRNTESEWSTNERGESFFIERGNQLSLAESGQPDEQQIVGEVLEVFGSW